MERGGETKLRYMKYATSAHGARRMVVRVAYFTGVLYFSLRRAELHDVSCVLGSTSLWYVVVNREADCQHVGHGPLLLTKLDGRRTWPPVAQSKLSTAQTRAQPTQ